jgi:pilus assembly protein FimV
VLKVTTAASVAEPYLDLLVEVNWASGRVVRAYTFLLDPPGATVPVAAVEP